jgi:hypothetical protein
LAGRFIEKLTAPTRSLRYPSRVQAHGPQAGRPNRVKVYRGSPKRVNRITFRGNWSAQFWICIVIVIVALLVILPRLIRTA